MKKVSLYIIDRWVIMALFLLLPILSVINFSGKYTAISLLFILAFVYYYRYKGLRLITASYPLILWLILTIYHWINAIEKKVPEVNALDLLHGLKIYSCMAIFAYMARRNFDKTVKSLLICFSIYLAMSFLVNDTSGFEGRFSGVMFATGLGQTAALMGIYIAYYSLRKNLSIIKSGLLYLLPIMVILLTQSRNSLAMLAIGIMGHAVALSIQRGLNIKKVVVKILILSVLVFFVYDQVIDNTDIGKRFTDTEAVKESQDVNRLTTGTLFDTVVGDRLIYYVLGWKYFMDSPVTGIGMWDFMYMSKGEFPLHSEYMVHLAEGGLIGAILWLLFIISVFRGVIKSTKFQYLKIIALFSLIEIMFCGIYARVFYYEFFYPIFGIAISLSNWGDKQSQKAVKHI